MRVDIAFAHDKTAIADAVEMALFKIIFLVKGNIAPFHDEVLLIFDDGFDDLTHDRPQIVRQLFVIGGCERSLPAADQSHFRWSRER